MLKNYFIINIPVTIKIIIWKKKKNINNTINFYNNNKFFKIITEKKIFFDKWFNCLMLNNEYEIKKKTRIINLFIEFLKTWDKFYFNKIKFKGKGFRIKFFKKIKLIKFYFGKSHKTFFFLKKIKKKRINKYKFILTSLNKNILINISRKIINIKKINLYTLRGLRNSRQIIYKRKGKKGTYI